jgi:hypothetical protein
MSASVKNAILIPSTEIKPNHSTAAVLHASCTTSAGGCNEAHTITAKLHYHSGDISPMAVEVEEKTT